MHTTTSRDGTPIAYDRTGSGPTLLLVDGAFGHRSFGPMTDLAPILAEDFTVVTYDRRHRGDSGNTAPYAVEREIEDIAAVIDAQGGSACLYGISSGAALAARAASALPKQVTKLVLYEPPFVVDDSRKAVPADYADRLARFVAADQRAAAIKCFMLDGVGVPAVFVAMMRLMPAWRKLKVVAHTLPYDTAVLGDGLSGRPLTDGEWAGVLDAIAAPTLVLSGGKSPVWLQHTVAAVARAIPDARLQTLPGQTHQVKATAIAPVIRDFVASHPAPAPSPR